jgi:hypothetical protein
MQITQFLVGGGSAFLHLFVYYQFPTASSKKTSSDAPNADVKEPWVPCFDTSAQAFAVWFNVIYLTPLTYLFARFFVRSYLRTTSGASANGKVSLKNLKEKKETVQAAGREAVKEIEAKGGVMEDTSATRVNGNGSAVNGNGITNGNGHAGLNARKGWERSNKVVD